MFQKKIVIPVLVMITALLALLIILFIKNGAGDILNAGKVVQGLDIKISSKYLDSIGDSKQLILVTAKDYGTSEATVRTFEKDGDKWKTVIPATPAIVGGMGFAAPGEKREGDGMSPTGTFTFGTCFGNKPNPGTKLAYRQTTDNDYWVDDSESKYYNTWQTGPSDGKWNSAENLGLTGTVYDYAAVIEYNTKEKTPKMGSAIFMHIWGSPSGSTGGCTAMAEETLVPILKWLNPDKKPIIMQGVADEIAGVNKK